MRGSVVNALGVACDSTMHMSQALSAQCTPKQGFCFGPHGCRRMQVLSHCKIADSLMR